MTAEKMPCLPVKITDKKWADSLQSGSLFMRSLYDYGSWSAIERAWSGDQQMKSGVQGDVGEGIVRRVDPKIGDDFFNRFEPQLRAVMEDCFYIEQRVFQYCKVFCMYGLTYLIPEQRYEKPDERLREFGDTAVIFLNPNEFLNRVLRGLGRQYGDNVNFRLDEIHYYPSDYYGPLDEFCKSASYAWQNEMRIRVALLNPENFIVDAERRKRKQIIQNTDSIIVNIGDIRDISIQIPVEDLIALKLPEVICPQK